MGSSSRIFLLTIVVQLLLMTGAEGSHGNQTWNLIDVGFEMLEMMKNIFELTKNVNKLQKTNQVLRSNGQQLQIANQALSSDIQQLQSANQALSSDVQQLQSANEVLSSDVQQLHQTNQALSSDVQQLHQTNQALSSDLQQLQNISEQITRTMIQGSQGGGIYTQWGRFNCTNNNTELVYSGYVGGSHNTHSGGAAEYVCLPEDPTYPANEAPRDRYYGYMYGAEYQQTSGSVFDHDVPCAVCRSRLSSIVMIPAKDKCHNGWTQQYHGTLASGYYGHAAASQYVCLDANPEVRPGGSGNMNGKLFYSVEANSNSNLPFPPYQSSKRLTCVVCAK